MGSSLAVTGCPPQLSPGLPGRAGMEGACFWPCWGCRATSPRGAVGPVQPSALRVNRLPEPSWTPCVAVLRSPSGPRAPGKGLILQIGFWEGPCPGEEQAREAGWQGPGCWSPRCDSPRTRWPGPQCPPHADRRPSHIWKVLAGAVTHREAPVGLCKRRLSLRRRQQVWARHPCGQQSWRGH